MTETSFLGGQTGNISQEYTERSRYQHLIGQYSGDYPLLDTVRSRRLYGFLDKDYHTVQPNASLDDEHVILFGDYAAGAQGINFVVELFNEFRDYYLDLIDKTGLTLPSDISLMTPTRCFEDLDADFEDYETFIGEEILAYVLERNPPTNNPNLLDFSDFLEEVKSFMFSEIFSPFSGIHTMTKSGFLISNRSSVHHTGLYIDLAQTLDVQIDEKKQEFLQNKDFKCYIEKAWEYGFFVDSNCPWRLILNLESRKVKENILNLEQTDRTLLQFHNFYSDQKLIKVGLGDYWQIKDLLKRKYIDYAREVMEQSVTIENSEDRDTSLDLNAALSLVPESQWIEFYVLCRLRELGSYTAQDYNMPLDPDNLTRAQKLARDLTNGAIVRYNRDVRFDFTNPGEGNLFGLTGPCGALGFIETRCCEILQDIITKAQIDYTEAERNRSDSNVSLSGTNYVDIAST